MSETVYVGIGTNIEPRMSRIDDAIFALHEAGTVLRVSSIYESTPYGVKDQPRFLNAVVALATDLQPPQLHAWLKREEQNLGRTERERWHEREIDFDVLFYGDTTIDTPNLVIPHADLTNRSFVLIPLQEIAPNIIHPVLGMTVEALAEPFAGTTDLKIVSPG